jgi:hypothetical protein
MTTDAKLKPLMDLMAVHRKNPAALRRLQAILLTQQGTLTAAQIGGRLNLARSTVFAYRRAYADHGPDGLLARLRAGRPAKRPSPSLERIIVKGLKLLSWFNIPALTDWIKHHDRIYPHWMVRRWALALIKKLKIRFRKDWRVEMANSLETWQNMARSTGRPPVRLQRERARRESTEPSLNLVIEESPGLRPWLDVAA